MSQEQVTFGLHTVEALLRKQTDRVLRLVVQIGREDKRIKQLIQLAESEGISIEYLNKQKLDHLTHEANHQGVVAFYHQSKKLTEEDLDIILQETKGPLFLLILDGIQDPHNLGACLRSADAAGVHAVIVPKDNAVGLTAVVTKTASGASETVPFIQVTNLVRTIEKLKKSGVWIYGASQEAEQTLFQTDLSGPCAIVLGAEGTGLRRLTREHCDYFIHIPMRGLVASLNVSVATGICLFEVVRQRMSSTH